MTVQERQLRNFFVTFPNARVDPGRVVIKSGTPISIAVQPQAPFVGVLGIKAGQTTWTTYYKSTTAEIGAIEVTLDEDVLASNLRIVAFPSLKDFAAFLTDFEGDGDGPPGHVGNNGIVDTSGG